jgi:hypothetical protein
MKKASLLFAALLMFSLYVLAEKPLVDTTTVTVQVGSSSKYAAINVIDLVNGNYVNATVTNVSVQNNNPEIATVAPNPTDNRSIRVSPIAAGTGTAVVSCHLSYVDPGDGLTKSEDKTITIAFTVIASPHGVKLSLLFN